MQSYLFRLLAFLYGDINFRGDVIMQFILKNRQCYSEVIYSLQNILFNNYHLQHFICGTYRIKEYYYV